MFPDATRVRCRQGDELLLQQTLFDAVVTAPMEAYWNAVMLDDRSPTKTPRRKKKTNKKPAAVPGLLTYSCANRVEPGMEAAFLGTRAGLMRIMRYAGVETRVAK